MSKIKIYTLKSNNEFDIQIELLGLKRKYNLIEYDHYIQGGFYSKKNDNKIRLIVKKWINTSASSYKINSYYLISK